MQIQLHYLLFGYGNQTWEYSPAYAINSYAYIVLHAFPAWIFKLFFPSNKIMIFFCLRIFLACISVFSEIYFYKYVFFCTTTDVFTNAYFFHRGVLKQFGPKIAKLTFFFLMFSAGMFHSSSAFLACSFSM